MGDPGEAPATILAREPDLKDTQPDDPIYGGAIRDCWTLLSTHALIVSAKPVPGPLALGAGRHVGLGVFAAMLS